MKIGGRRPPPAPDAELIRSLAALLAETGLSEIEYEGDGFRLRVARETRAQATIPAPPPQPVAAVAAAPVETPSAANGHDHPGAVKAPMVGVAYLAPQPGTPPFVRLGETVSEGQTLLIIEAMKVMNQICAPRPGRVARILIEDSEPVEYGAALMLIE